MKPVLNIAEVEPLSADPSRAPTGAAAERFDDRRRGEIAKRIGARKLGCGLIVVAPGKSACPFHCHRAEEEMFYIIEGKGELRYGADRYSLRPGDVIACPTGGPDTAHQIFNTGDTELRYLGISNNAEVEICEYPDSGKIGVYCGAVPDPRGSGEPIRHLTRGDAGLDYWDGE